VIDLINRDFGCASSSFSVAVSAPTGFSVSLPTSSVTLKSSGSTALTATVTSPAGGAPASYPITFTATRSADASPATVGSYYFVYNSDTVAPTIYWPSVADGQTISGSSFQIAASSYDDHAVKKMEVYLDNVLKATQTCDDIAYSCQVSYAWSLRGVRGQHTAVFKATDWLGNVGVQSATFTVG
jgi:hypothetical protein